MLKQEPRHDLPKHQQHSTGCEMALSVFYLVSGGLLLKGIGSLHGATILVICRNINLSRMAMTRCMGTPSGAEETFMVFLGHMLQCIGRNY